jgi:hypothetical protein
MPHRLKLSPLQRDIMVTLEEAGAETIGTVIATVKANEVEFTRNVDGLIELGLVRTEETKPSGGLQTELVLTERGKSALMEWSPPSGLWRDYAWSLTEGSFAPVHPVTGSWHQVEGWLAGQGAGFSGVAGSILDWTSVRRDDHVSYDHRDRYDYIHVHQALPHEAKSDQNS